jgi:hypothetical protein
MSMTYYIHPLPPKNEVAFMVTGGNMVPVKITYTKDVILRFTAY